MELDERVLLARERTLLSWQRNRLSEISVLLSVTGIGLVVHKFYPENAAFGLFLIAASLAGLAYVVWRYFSVKKTWRGHCQKLEHP
ncbi:MAG: DUF202 domain-containing protein [Candidatus Micrarchaeia archaeon]